MIGKKIENFWYYHKFKVIIAIFAVILIIIAGGTGSGGEADLEIGYVLGDSEIILKNAEEKVALFESLLEGKDKDKAFVSVLPLTPSRIEIEFVIGISQILLLNKETLEPLINHIFFEPLDKYVDKYNIDLTDFPEVKAAAGDSKDQKVYALPVKECDLLIEMGIPEDYYFTIRLPKENDSDDARKNKNAHIILDYILSNDK